MDLIRDWSVDFGRSVDSSSFSLFSVVVVGGGGGRISGGRWTGSKYCWGFCSTNASAVVCDVPSLVVPENFLTTTVTLTWTGSLSWLLSFICLTLRRTVVVSVSGIESGVVKICSLFCVRRRVEWRWSDKGLVAFNGLWGDISIKQKNKERSGFS